MNHVRLTDLDELALTVRDRASRSYISEAINAYRGGANRAAIISAWIAVTSDIISKIRELASQADPNAVTFVSLLDAAIGSNNISQLIKIENKLLQKARDEFEFLTPHEYSDLDNLKADRHLCAHPAFVAEESLFQPTPERVRTHIVHAVIHLLQHQPVQGKSALERIVTDIIRLSFPADAESVANFLNAKYLNNAKSALVRNLVVLLVKKLLKGDDPDFVGREQAVAHCLMAVSRRHHTIYETTMSAKLPETANSLDDSQLPSIFRLLEADQRCWEWIGEPTRIRIRGLLKRYGREEMVQNGVFSAMSVDELKPYLLSQIESLTFEERERVVTENPRAEFGDIAVSLYCAAGSFRSAERLGTNVLLPMAEHFSQEQIVRLLSGAGENDQIIKAIGSPPIFERFLDLTRKHLTDEQVKQAWGEFVGELDVDPDGDYYFPGLRKKLDEYGVSLE